MSATAIDPRPAAGDDPVGASSRPGVPTPLRADIQGMRALAVLIVIGAHAGLSPLQGGFVGVDVFFVISGYLISRLLFLEASRGESIGLGRFYARRARRILPAATFVSLVTLIASVFLLGTIDALDVVYDAAWAAGFAANIHFASRGVDYFAQDQGLSPLQHYWSLSVEEQFYVVWPLVLVACLMWTRRHNGLGRLPRVPVLGALVALAVVSFAYAAWLTHANPVAAYFSTPARIWELAAGAILALIGTHVVSTAGTQLRSLLSATGLGLIAVSCLEFGEETAFPGSAALLPVLGTVLVLLAGAGEGPRPWMNRMLGAAPLRVLGDWSYSLYLWHWPVLILARRTLDRELLPGETAIALLAILGLSAATFWWVETPFRTGRQPASALTTGRVRPVRVGRSLALYPLTLALVATTCTGAGLYLTWQGGEHGANPAVQLSDYRSRAPGAPGATGAADPIVALVEASARAATEGRPIPSDLTPDLLKLRDDVAPVGACDYTEDFSALCPGGVPDSDKSLALIGDSHARAWIPAFDEIAQAAGYTTYYLVRPQCTAARVDVAAIYGRELDQGCSDFRDWAIKQINRLDVDLVVVATAPAMKGVYANGSLLTSDRDVAAQMSAGYADLFTQLQPAQRRVVLIRDVPRSLGDTGECLAKRRSTLKTCIIKPDPRSEAMAEVSVRAAAKAGVEVIDPTRWFCAQGTCPPVIGSTIPLRDLQHITVSYARELAEPLGRALELLP
ncbi:MAG: acyltransferase family protein [Nocardioides sp.]